jgi:hypothetical protein
MTLLNFLTNDYPCNLYEVRQANPNVSFPANPSDEDLQPFGYANVHPTPQPSYDQRTERIEEATPEPDADGICRQQWTIRPATADEIAAYDIANAPAPDWMAFGIDLATHPGISALWEALPGPVAGALPTALNEAGKGDPRLFAGIWQRILATGAIAPELLGAIAALAAEHHLPEVFIAGLAPAAPERERARDADGQFIADDPSTPDVDEAWA